MRIAFVSAEFPPYTDGGGIGTYLANCVLAMHEYGHEVEVFTQSSREVGVQTFHWGKVYLVEENENFANSIASVFIKRHQIAPFDVIEGNDFDAPAIVIKEQIPELPYVVKLHTPRYVIEQLHQQPKTLFQRIGIQIGALRRGRLHREPPPKQSPAATRELQAIDLADEIAAPSQAILDRISEDIGNLSGRSSVFPYIFDPDPVLLSIPVETETNRITFIGRLEPRKGVEDIAAAIPLVLTAFPNAKFRFIGRSMPHPSSNVPMEQILRKQVRGLADSVEFMGPVSSCQVAKYLGDTDICVFPSHWESFGLVCCEAMAAARGVIGSSSGGMAEILDRGEYGELIPPKDPEALAVAIIRLLSDKHLRFRLGRAARQQILRRYSRGVVVREQLGSYERAIWRCQRKIKS